MATLKGKSPSPPKARSPRAGKAGKSAAPSPAAAAPTPNGKAPAGKPNGALGVIGTIIALLKNGGGTAEELTRKLAERFPERDPKGMGTTVRIQVKRLDKEGKLRVVSEEIEGRGTVYRAAE